MYGISLLIGVLLLAIAIPYVAAVRHPSQKPLAAYLVFTTVFFAAGFVLFMLGLWLAGLLGVGSVLNNPVAALVFILLVSLPAIALATWQIRKPPMQQGGPPP